MVQSSDELTTFQCVFICMLDLLQYLINLFLPAEKLMTVEFTNKVNRTWLSNLFLDPGFLPVKDIQSESILMCYKVPPVVWDWCLI